MRIGEVSDRVGIPTSTIRYYERTQLIDPPERTEAGYRNYGSATVDRLAFIRDAQVGGLTLNQIGSILGVRDAGETPCAHVSALLDERLGEVEAGITALQATKAELTKLRSRASRTDPAQCGDDDICVIIQPSQTST